MVAWQERLVGFKHQMIASENTMDKAKIQGEDIFCPLCGNTHQVIRKTVMATALLNGEKVPYEQETWLCANSPDDENEFVPANVMDENLNRARNAYWKLHGLLL